MMKHTTLLSLCLAGSALVSTSVMAEDNFYVGARAGSDLDGRYENFLPNTRDDNSYGATFDWYFHDNWGLELGYARLGELYNAGVADAGYRLDGDLATAGIQYRHPIGDSGFELLSGVGAFDLNEDGTGFGVAGPYTINNDDSGAYVEVGARYRFESRAYDFTAELPVDAHGLVEDYPDLFRRVAVEPATEL